MTFPSGLCGSGDPAVVTPKITLHSGVNHPDNSHMCYDISKVGDKDIRFAVGTYHDLVWVKTLIRGSNDYKLSFYDEKLTECEQLALPNVNSEIHHKVVKTASGLMVLCGKKVTVYDTQMVVVFTRDYADCNTVVYVSPWIVTTAPENCLHVETLQESTYVAVASHGDISVITNGSSCLLVRQPGGFVAAGRDNSRMLTAMYNTCD